MEVFLNNITSFPVVVFTFILAIVICYWVLALIGAVDIEIFDADIDLDTEIDAQSLSGVTGFMLKWGLTGVPVTVVVSILLASSWLVCYVAVSVLFPMLPWGILKTLVGSALLLVSFALSIPITAQFIKPLKGIFISHSAAVKSSFIGRECLVKTGTVNEKFGQAEYEDGGAGMLFDVRAHAADGIKKGDKVIIKDYDENDGSYWVIKPKELDQNRFTRNLKQIYK